MRPLSLLALVLSAGVARAQPVPTDFTVPDNPVPANSYAEVRYALPTKGDVSVLWTVHPEPTKSGYAVQLDGDGPDAGRLSVLYFNGSPGVYTVTADVIDFGAKKVVRKKLTVTVGAKPPEPGPKPPDPVPPPKPVDPLLAKLRVAFEASAGTTQEKSGWAKDLAALYRAAAKLAADPALTTAGQLKQKLKDASAALVGADALKEVRQAVAGELAGVLPTADGDLTDAQRVAAAALFTRLAAVLDELGK